MRASKKRIRTGEDGNGFLRNVKAKTSNYGGPSVGTGPLAYMLPELREHLYSVADVPTLGCLASTCHVFYRELAATPDKRIWLPGSWRRAIKEAYRYQRPLLLRVIAEKVRPSGLFQQIANVNATVALFAFMDRARMSLTRGPDACELIFYYATGIGTPTSPITQLREVPSLADLIEKAQALNATRKEARELRKRIPVEHVLRVKATQKEERVEYRTARALLWAVKHSLSKRRFGRIDYDIQRLALGIDRLREVTQQLEAARAKLVPSPSAMPDDAML
jgi:hypothetical protein